jgi:DNA-binding protein HU-beta
MEVIIMSKTELVAYIAEETGLTKADSARAVEAFVNGVTAGLKKEGKVTLTGFATFAAKKKEAKTGRNPRTGAPVKIPARVAVTVKAGSKLKDALN